MLKFSITKPVAEANRATVLDIIEATEGLNNAWMDLTEAQRNLDEVCQVMENIQQSIDVLSQFGTQSIAPLNIDKCLENLLGVEEKLITAEKAQEGLGDALRKAWETFKEWVRKIWDLIVRAFQAVVNFIKKIFDTGSDIAGAIVKSIDRHPAEESLHEATESIHDDYGTGYVMCCSPAQFDRSIKILTEYLDFSILAVAEYKSLYGYLNSLASNTDKIDVDSVLDRIDSSMNSLIGTKFGRIVKQYEKTGYFTSRRLTFGNGASSKTYEFYVPIKPHEFKKVENIKTIWNKSSLKRCASEIAKGSRMYDGYSRLNTDPELKDIVEGRTKGPAAIIDRLDSSKLDRSRMMALRLLVNFMENILFRQLLQGAVFEFVRRCGEYQYKTIKNVAEALDVDYREYL